MNFIKTVIFTTLFGTIGVGHAHDCLPLDQKYVLNDQRFIVRTVHHPKYDEAEKLLIKELPSSGFLQHIKAEEVKKLTSNSYAEKRTIESSLSVNVEHWIKYSCHHRGDYYITAVIGKDDISYVKMKPPKEINLKAIKKFCKGHEKIMLVAGTDALRFTADKQMKVREKYGKAFSEFTDWHVGCGRASVYSIDKKYKVFKNELEDFVYFNEYSGGTKDTIPMWLELTKGLR